MWKSTFGKAIVTGAGVRLWPKDEAQVALLSVCYRESCLPHELLILTSHSEMKYSIENLFYRLMEHGYSPIEIGFWLRNMSASGIPISEINAAAKKASL